MAALLTTFLVAVFPGNIAQYVKHVDGLGLDSDRKRLQQAGVALSSRAVHRDTAPEAVAYGLADEVIGGSARVPESGTPG